MTKKKLSDEVEVIMQALYDVEDYFINLIGQQIQTIGELNQSSINRIVIMTEMNNNIADLNARIAAAANKTAAEMKLLYQRALQDTYTDPRFAKALHESPLSADSRKRLENYTEAISRQTAGKLYNLSNTSVVSDVYIKAIDKAILAVSSGLGDYKGALRQTIIDLGGNGIQIQYPSGYHRRLDSAARQNIVDGAHQIQQHASDMMGEELGFDAFELTAHLNSAPDHEPVQGRVFLKKEFESMQAGFGCKDIDGNSYAGFERPIGEWNCMHMAMSFSTKHSIRRYTDQQLNDWKAQNNQGATINGKHMTLYQVDQLMRRIETKVRREKDVAVAAKAAGDMQLRKECQERINRLAARYQQISKDSGLPQRKDRMKVEGFRMVKV